MLDDVRASDTETLLNAGYMPNLQQFIVNQGIAFDNSFVTTSLCGPSRATFLTGQYSHNHGVTCNQFPDQSHAVELLNHNSTLPVWLRAAGYRTAHVGKYLNGYGAGTKFTIGPKNPRWIPPGWDDWFGLVDFSTYVMYGFTVNENRELMTYEGTPENYQTDVLARLTVRAIERAEAADNSPLFLSITPLAAHYEHSPDAPKLSCTHDAWELTIRPAPRHAAEDTLPPDMILLEGPAFNEEDMTDKPAHLQALPPLSEDDKKCVRHNYRERLKSLLAVDDLIGQVVGALQQNGEWANTIFVVTSDNGFFLGEHRMTQKVLAYEPSIRVPLYIRVPTSAAQRSAAFVVNNDLAATVVQLAAAQPDLALDGRSLVPLFANPNPTNWRKRFMVEYLGPAAPMPFRAVRTAPTDTNAPNSIAVLWNDGSEELYAISRQPEQLTNLASDPRFEPALTYLRMRVDQLKNCVGNECRAVEDE
jgi:arylsulfatase A-like enzyme